MKTIRKLNENIQDFRGIPAMIQARPQDDPVPLTIKDALVILAGSAQTQGKDLVIIRDTAKKILLANGFVEVENHEFELIKQACDQNGARYTNNVMAPVHDAIQAALKEAEEGKPDNA